MKKFTTALLLLLFVFSVSCRETTQEKAQDALEAAAEDTENNLENAGEAIEEAVEETGDAIENAGEEINEEIEGTDEMPGGDDN
ncbi:MAG: hypothetical protein CMC35_04605 [Flavobacteriaceae bacterium]|nr:hypothetical protein [Flavobacteriaceae bacterium]|tara:strand:+ start:3656 stop:3907 length:252 start_codon:yes stop_codon:yes gene_type:complete